MHTSPSKHPTVLQVQRALANAAVRSLEAVSLEGINYESREHGAVVVITKIPPFSPARTDEILRLLATYPQLTNAHESKLQCSVVRIDGSDCQQWRFELSLHKYDAPKALTSFTNMVVTFLQLREQQPTPLITNRLSALPSQDKAALLRDHERFIASMERFCSERAYQWGVDEAGILTVGIKVPPAVSEHKLQKVLSALASHLYETLQLPLIDGSPTQSGEYIIFKFQLSPTHITSPQNICAALVYADCDVINHKNA